MQYVKVDLHGRAYTYQYDGDELLKAGDTIRVPGNKFNPNPAEAKVIRVLEKSDYDGPLAAILEKVE